MDELTGRPGAAVAGRVAWLDGGVVETYAHLEDWFRTVIELHRQELARLLHSAGDAVPQD